MEKKMVKENKCLSCKFLEYYFEKKRKSPYNCHYQCIHLTSFNNPPVYCKYYEYKK